MLALVTLALAVSTPPPNLVDQVRSALIGTSMRPGRVVQMSGTCRYLGSDGPYSLVFGDHERFVQAFNSTVGEVYGCDGSRAWKREMSGAPVVISFETEAEAKAMALLLTDEWIEPGPDIAVASSGKGTLAVKFGSEGFEMDVAVAPDTSLPRTGTIASPEGTITISLSDWKRAGGRLLANHVDITHVGVTDVIRVSKTSEAKDRPGEFDTPKWTATDATFDPSGSPLVESKRAATGHVLVHPLVNGRDVGWFILDSGAETMTMDPGIAAKMGLPKLGEAPETGVGGSITGSIYGADSVSLGPLTIHKQRIVGFDMKEIAPFFGVPLAGIVGYDVFRRSIVELSLNPIRVSIYDPAKYAGPSPRWETLRFDGGNSAVQATTDGKTGWYRVDTGDSGWVTFQYPYVVRENMLKRFSHGEGLIAGAGGALNVKVGTVPDFEFGGHTFNAVQAIFSVVDKGGFSDVFLAGNIGQHLMEPFTLVFDYQQYRLGFRDRGSGIIDQSTQRLQVRRR